MALFRRRPRRPKMGGEPFNEGIYHRPPGGLSFFKTGVLALIVILILSFFAYTKELPWSEEGYTATATFQNPSTLRETNPVRIAGVNVGEVTKVEPDGEGAKVTFTVDEEGLPLKEDATIVIRPRLFLEGNLFLDLRPGSPSAEDLPDGGDIPVTQTATAVQLDEVLTALQRPDRVNLARLLDGYGSALYDTPTPEEDRGQDPEVQGLSGAEAINESFRYGGEAGKGTSQVNEAFQGMEPGDLSGLINSSGRVFQELAANESDLRGLITNFSVTMGAFADESQSLQATLEELAPLAEEAPEQLITIDRSFPPLRAFARELTPGVKVLPETIRAGNPWLLQARQLLQRDELGGIVNDLEVATPPLARGTSNLVGLFGQLRDTSRCVTNVLDPTGEVVITDQFNNSGNSNWEEFLFSTVAQAGIGGNFDGNGIFLRGQPAGGDIRVSTPVPGGDPGSPFQGPDNVLYGNTVRAPQGTQPPKPSTGKPPLNLDARCGAQEVPDINGSQATVGAPNPAVP